MNKRLLEIAGMLFSVSLIWFMWLLIVSGFTLQEILENMLFKSSYLISFIGSFLIPILIFASFILFLIGLFKKN